MIEPMILKASIPNPSPTNLGPYFLLVSTYRRDTWPSREEAAQTFRTSKAYKSWDKRAIELWIEHGLRDLPTKLYPSGSKGVTLTTPKHHEVNTYFRPIFGPINKRTHPDIDPTTTESFPFYRHEAERTLNMLPYLRPSVLYIAGTKSPFAQKSLREARLSTTGTAVGGNGGHETGRVEEAVLPAGHLVPFEVVGACAETTGNWIAKEMEEWRKDEEKFRWEKAEKETMNEKGVGEEWMRQLGKYIKPPKACKL